MLPAKVASGSDFENPAEREAIIRTLLQLKQDVDYLKDVVAKAGLTRSSAPAIAAPETEMPLPDRRDEVVSYDDDPEDQYFEAAADEDMSIKTANQELIEKVLKKHGGNRKAAAAELGISERTLYRKIKQLG
jgi:transcriptional regulator with PAS, ATPase and Fis domain